MILVKSSAKLIQTTGIPLTLIERAGRICYKSEDKITPESNIKFTEMILKRGHESVIEHASATVHFICDRGVSHEIVRHRIASYSQESTRYCDYNNNNVTFIIPSWIEDINEGEYTYSSLFPSSENVNNQWFGAMLDSESYYKILRENGWKPEQARSILPNSLKTEIVMTANFREWRHFFKLRTSQAAHPDMRNLTINLLEDFKKSIPVIFEDI